MGKTLVQNAKEPKRVTPYNVEMLGPEQINHYWPFFAAELERVPHIWRPWWTLESLYDGALEGEMQIWCAGPGDLVRLVVFTKITNFPAARMLHCFLAFGNGLDDDALDALVAQLQRFAKDFGCERAEIVGRAGWEQKLKKYGFKKDSVAMTLDFPNERLH